VGIKLGPIDGNECTRWLVPQKCEGQTEEYESCRCTHENEEYSDNSSYDAIIGFNGKEAFEDGADDGGDVSEGECSNWGDSYGEGSDTPEFLFCVRGENKVPSCTMNGTEHGAKSDQEQGMRVVIFVMRDMECRNVCGVIREGS